MFYITGDTHGDFCRYIDFSERFSLSNDDVMVVLGDAGLNYYGNKRDERAKEFVNSFPFITFCIHGNHEMRPDDVPTYKTKNFCGGLVWYEQKYPNILFAKDGEIYNFDGLHCIVIGGAYSVDKHYRLERGLSWFSNEQPSEQIKSFVEQRLKERNFTVDVVLSHTCPIKYEPIEVFLPFIDQSKVDKSTEIWLGEIEKKAQYKKWYCGHFHTIKKIDNIQFMFDDIDVLRK